MSREATHIPHFDSYVCPGDTVAFERGLFTFTARLEYDSDTTPEDYDCFDVADPNYGAKNAAIIKAWRDYEWFYCGVVISAKYNGVKLPDSYLASLWGVEANFPNSDNKYLSEIVEELLPEAEARAIALVNDMRAKLAAPSYKTNLKTEGKENEI